MFIWVSLFWTSMSNQNKPERHRYTDLYRNTDKDRLLFIHLHRSSSSSFRRIFLLSSERSGKNEKLRPCVHITELKVVGTILCFTEDFTSGTCSATSSFYFSWTQILYWFSNIIETWFKESLINLSICFLWLKSIFDDISMFDEDKE